MIRWVLFFFFISVIAGALGFTNVSAASAEIAKIIFYIFAALFLVGVVLLVLGK